MADAPDKPEQQKLPFRLRPILSALRRGLSVTFNCSGVRGAPDRCIQCRHGLRPHGPYWRAAWWEPEVRAKPRKQALMQKILGAKPPKGRLLRKGRRMVLHIGKVLPKELEAYARP